MAGLSTGAPIVQVYHEKSIILPDVSRVLACLYEKDMKFTTHTASYKSLLRLQASTHAPVPFYDGPTFLEESREICYYIAEKYEHHGYPFLLGKDALERASVEQWLHNEEHAFNPPSRALFCHLAFPLNEEDDGDEIDMHTRKLEEVLEVYEQRLSDSEFLAGNKFTLADLVHLPNSHYITASDKFLYLYDSRKNVRRWWDTISTRDSWQQVLKDMKRVEEQNKQEELKKQQQQKDHPRTTGYPNRIYYRKLTSIEPRTILVPPDGTVSSSPIVPQIEKPLPTDIADEALASSSQRTPTDHKTSVAQSKDTNFFTAPQEKSLPKPPTPVQRKFTPVTSPTTAEKPPIVDVTKIRTKDASSPEPTKTDLPTRQKPSESRNVSNNLHLFDYKATSHTEEATAYIEPTPEKTSETLDTFSGPSMATGHTKTSPISAKEEPDHPSASDLYKSDSAAAVVDSQDKEPVPYSERTPQSARPTDTDAHHKLQAEQWHAATAGLSNLKEDADYLMPVQQVKPSKDVHQYPSQDSEQATSDSVPQETMGKELVQGQEKTTQRPYTDQRDVSSPLPQQTSDAWGVAEDDRASSDLRGALLPPSIQERTAIPPSRKAAAKDVHGTTPPQAGYLDDQDTNKRIAPDADTPASKLHTTDVHHKLQAEQWHAATGGLSNLKEDDDHLMPVQQVKPSKDVHYHQYPSHDSEQATSHSVPQETVSEELIQGQEKTTQRPYTDQRDVSSPLPQQTSGAWGVSQGDKASSDPRGALLPPSVQEHAAIPPSRKAAKDAHGTTPPQAGYRGDQDTNKRIAPDADTAASKLHTTDVHQKLQADHAIIDDKFAKKSIIDERVGEPKQMQAPMADARPASEPTKRKTDGHETGDLETPKATQGPATIREYSLDAAIDERIASYNASSDQLVTGSLHEQARPPASTHESTEPIGGPTSKEPQLGGTLPAEVTLAEHKSAPSDQEPARAAPLSPVEPVNTDSNFSAGDYTIAPRVSWQQFRPSAPATRGVPASDSQSVIRKIQEVSPDDHGNDDSGKPLVPSQEQISHASQTIPRREDMTSSPGERDSPKPDIQLPSAQVREVSPDESSEIQGSRVGSAVGTDELGPAERKIAPSEEPSSVEPRKEQPVVPIAEQIKALPTVIGQGAPDTREVSTSEDVLETIPTHGDVHPTSSAEPARKSFSVQGAEPTSSAQAPPLYVADDSSHTGATPADAFGNAQSVKPLASTDAEHGQDSVRSKPPPSEEQRNEEVGDSAHETQQISSTRSRKGDAAVPAPDQAKDSRTTFGRQGILPAPVNLVSPEVDTQDPSSKDHEDVPADDFGEVKPSISASAPDIQHDTTSDEVAAPEQRFVSSVPTSSTEPRKKEIRDSAPSTQLISSTESRKEDAVIATPDQDKDMQTTLDQQDILAAPVRSASPSSDTQRPSEEAREDAPADDLGEAASTPSTLVREVRPPTVVPSSAPETKHGAARDEEALDKQIFLPPGQDSVNSTQLPSSRERNGENGGSSPSRQWISSTRPRKGDAVASASDQDNNSQTTLGRQDILPPIISASPSSDNQRPSANVHEDVPAEAFGETKPIVQALAPDKQDETAPVEVAPDEQKFVPSEPTSSTERRKKENRGSAPSTQIISSTVTRKEDAIISAPDQDKDLQTTLYQQDQPSAPVRSASPFSDTQRPSEEAREDVPADDLGEAASKTPALVREVRPPTVVPASVPATQHGAVPDEVARDEQKSVLSGQDSAQSVQPSFSSEPTKDDPVVTASDQTEDLQTIIHQQNITPAPDTAKTPFPGRDQVSLGRHDSDRLEGQTTEPYRTTVDEKTTTSPSSKAYSSEPGSDLTPTRTDVRPSIGEGPTETSFPEHDSQTQPPSATEDISLDASSKAKSAGPEAKAPLASASDAQSGATQPQDEAAPVEQNFAVPGNGEVYAGPADQMNVRQTIFGNQAARRTPGARADLSKYQESSRDDDHISNLANPLVSQEQASHTERASAGATSEVRSVASDKKTMLPSGQAQTSNTGPDSTLVTGDAHLSSADVLATSTSQNQESQPPAATQAPTTQAQQGSASTQKVHADSLENTETPRQPSKDQVMAPVTISAAHSDSPQGEPGTTTVQSPREASFDLSGDEKTTTIQGDQVNTLPNGDRLTSQVVGPSESRVSKRIYAERKLEGVSTDEKSKAQQQIAQSDTPSSKDNNKEADEVIRLNLSKTHRKKQSSWPKENMESSEESGRQQQADQAIVQSAEGNMKQVAETKIRDTETGEPEEREPQGNTNQTNNRASPVEALESSGKQTSGVQLPGRNTKDVSNSTDDAPAYTQTVGNSEDILRSSEESKVQQQPEGKTQGGEPEALSSETEQPKGRDNSTQFQAEASDRFAEQSSPGIRNKNKGSGGWDGPTDGTKSGDMEDKPQ